MAMAIIKPRVKWTGLESDHSQKYWFKQWILVLQLVHQLAVGAKDAVFRLVNKLGFNVKAGMQKLFHVMGFNGNTTEVLKRQHDTHSCKIEQLLERKLESEKKNRRKIEPKVAKDFLGTGDAEVYCTGHARNPCTIPSVTKRYKFSIRRRRGTRRVATMKKEHALLIKRTQELELCTQKMEYQLRFYEKELDMEVKRATTMEKENVALKKELQEVCEEREQHMNANRAEINKHLENKAKKGDSSKKGRKPFLTMTDKKRIASGFEMLSTTKKNPAFGSKNWKSKKPGFLKRVFKCYYCF